MGIQAFLLFLSSVAASNIHYAIIPRGGRILQVTESPTIAPVLPSFDGDLDAILQLALQRATEPPTLVPSTYPSDAPSVIPSTWKEPTTKAPTSEGLSSDAPSLVPSDLPSSQPSVSAAPSVQLVNPHECPNASTESMLVVSYRYSLEVVPAASMPLVASESEEILQKGVGPIVLECWNEDAAGLGIVALDSLPADSVATDETCTPTFSPDNTCTVFNGKMRFFLSDAGNGQDAIEFILPVIESIILNDDFLEEVGSGLVHAEFLGAAPNTNAIESDGAQPAGSSSEGNFGLTSVVLLTVGSAALIVFVGSVYYWRSTFGRAPVSSAATQAAGSTLNGSALNDTTNTSFRPTSPFSEMLPDAYRFNENMSILSGQGPGGMSAIAEDEEMTVHSQTSSAIMMSEAGFSTEAGAETDTSLLSLDVPKSLYSRHPESPNLLGARKRNPTQVGTLDDSTDVDTSTEGPDSPPRAKGKSSLALLDQGALDDGNAKTADDSMQADDMMLFC